MPCAAHHALLCELIPATLARRSRRLGASAVLCTLALTSTQALGQDLEPTLLVYRAPPECPLVGDFQHSVERRSSRIHFVDEGSHARELSIFLRKDGDLTIGELRLIEANGNLRQRSVRFPSCADAVEGLALIATVSLDPQALLGDTKSVPQPPPEPPPKRPETPRPPAPATTPPPLPPARKTRERSLEVALGAEANAFFRLFPEPAFGGSLFVDVGSGSRHWFAPELRGAITYVMRDGVLGDVQDSRANVKLALVTVLGCPVKFGGSTLVFRPCAFIAGGDLYTRGSGSNESNYNAQLSWGGAAQLTLHVAKQLEFVGDANVGVTAIRDRFWFATPDFSVAWTTPAVYISTGLGFRVLLP